MKRKYEIVYIFDSTLEEPEVNERLDRFHELLKSPDNIEPIAGIAHWGKRTLAYPINNKEVGYYVVAHFEADTKLLSEFERIIKLDDTVIRYLVVINEGLSVDRPDHTESPDDSTEEFESDGDDRDEVTDTPVQPAEAATEADTDDEPAKTTEGGDE
jgi:small subunit ribosomal protein S6